MAQPAYTLISGPDTEPVSVAEMKSWMRVDGVEDDADIAALITENRARAERVTGKVLVSQTWRLNLDYFPTGDEISVERPPLSSVSAITYYDTANAQQTLATSVYQVDSASQPARILLVDGQWWPATYSRAHAVTISFIAGVSAANVNPEFVGRLKAAVAYCYRNREQRDEMYLDSLFASLWGGTY